MKKQNLNMRASGINKRRLTLARSTIRALTESEQIVIVAGVQPQTDSCCGTPATTCKSK
jgi:hypothetical protein